MAGWNDLKSHMNIPVEVTKHDAWLTQCYNTAVEAVDEVIGLNVVPTNARNTAVLAAGARLFMSKVDANPGQPGAAPTGANPRDFLSVAYPILAPYMAVGL